jgi:mono/diheme cytochrome c family protein
MGPLRIKFFKHRMKSLILLGAVIITTSSCDYNRKTTGWEYFRDMAHSPAYESYSPNPNFPDGKTMQAPVDGTVPREMIPYPYQKTDQDRALAAKTLANKLAPTKEILARGKTEYEIYCMNCHGEKGDGKGFLFTSGKFPLPPGNLLSPKMMANPESDIYHVITVGFGIMSAHGSMIRTDDRWKIAMYIKQELQKQ